MPVKRKNTKKTKSIKKIKSKKGGNGPTAKQLLEVAEFDAIMKGITHKPFHESKPKSDIQVLFEENLRKQKKSKAKPEKPEKPSKFKGVIKAIYKPKKSSKKYEKK